MVNSVVSSADMRCNALILRHGSNTAIARRSRRARRKSGARQCADGLLDGRALTATELAYAAGVAPQTASGHLAKLTEGRLLALTKQGRHSYYRLASPLIGRMLERHHGRPLPTVHRVPDALARRRRAAQCPHLLRSPRRPPRVALADALMERDCVDVLSRMRHRDPGRGGVLSRAWHRPRRVDPVAPAVLPAMPRLERAP